MYIFISLLVVINLFAFNYAEDSYEASDEVSDEASDEATCKEYYEALDEEILKMIKEKKMPTCWDEEWNKMQEEEEDFEMDVTEYDKFEDCLKEAIQGMENKPEPSEECVAVMKKQSSSEDSLEESDEDSLEESDEES